MKPKARKYLHRVNSLRLAATKRGIEPDSALGADVTVMVEWWESAREGIEHIQLLPCTELESQQDEFFSELHDLIKCVEKVANKLYTLDDLRSPDVDRFLGTFFWHNLGANSSTEWADHYFRRSGDARLLALSNVAFDEKNTRAYRDLALAELTERYLDGVGVYSDPNKIGELVEQLGGCDRIKNMRHHCFRRLYALLLENGSGGFSKNIQMASQIAEWLYEYGELNSAELVGRLGVSRDDGDDESGAKIGDVENCNLSPLDESEAEQENTDEMEADERTVEERLNEELAKLNNLVGLRSVKEQVSSLVSFEQIESIRQSRGISRAEAPSRHVVLLGNPGTGKTTVARILGRIYHILGILRRNRFVEVNRTELVGGYLGQTAIKTQSVIDRALDGVLFIDEAYSLCNREDDSFGAEAIEVLLKAMEDNRSRLVVIVAGYADKMESFLNANPGLRSRFNTKIFFEDYSAEERVQILISLGKSQSYSYSDDALRVASSFFSKSLNNPDSDGNGRFVRNYFERCRDCHAGRIHIKIQNGGLGVSDQELTCITDVDASAAAKYWGIEIEMGRGNVSGAIARAVAKAHNSSPLWLHPVGIRHSAIEEWPL